MRNKPPYHVRKLSFLRKAVIASASTTRQKNAIHFFTEIDVSLPEKIIEQYRNDHGVKLSFTAYLVKSLAGVVIKYPGFNSFISGNRHVFIDELNISVLVERKMGDEYVPEPMVIRNAGDKTYLDVHNEIRKAQESIRKKEEFGNLSNAKYFRFIPGFLLKAFVKIADRNIRMGVKYGKLAITSVGMFSRNPLWLIPHGTATVLLSVGSMVEKKTEENGISANKKHLCLTVSFDHDIIDGAPGARFMNDLIEEIRSGNALAGVN